jgi:hypothetical protein
MSEEYSFDIELKVELFKMFTDKFKAECEDIYNNALKFIRLLEKEDIELTDGRNYAKSLDEVDEDNSEISESSSDDDLTAYVKVQNPTKGLFEKPEEIILGEGGNISIVTADGLVYGCLYDDELLTCPDLNIRVENIQFNTIMEKKRIACFNLVKKLTPETHNSASHLLDLSIIVPDSFEKVREKFIKDHPIVEHLKSAEDFYKLVKVSEGDGKQILKDHPELEMFIISYRKENGLDDVCNPDKCILRKSTKEHDLHSGHLNVPSEKKSKDYSLISAQHNNDSSPDSSLDRSSEDERSTISSGISSLVEDSSDSNRTDSVASKNNTPKDDIYYGREFSGETPDDDSTDSSTKPDEASQDGSTDSNTEPDESSQDGSTDSNTEPDESSQDGSYSITLGDLGMNTYGHHRDKSWCEVLRFFTPKFIFGCFLLILLCFIAFQDKCVHFFQTGEISKIAKR